MIRKNVCKEQGFILTHGSRGVSLCLLGSVVSGPVITHSILAERVSWSRTAHVLRDPKEGWVQGQSTAPRNTYPRTPYHLPSYHPSMD